MDRRAQAFTLEGLIAALLVASALILGAQAVDVGLVTNSVSQESITERRAQASGILDIARDRGDLKRAVTCVENVDGEYEPNDAAYDPDPNDSTTSLGPMLDATFNTEGISYNVYLRYWPDSGVSDEPNQKVVYPALDERSVPRSNVVTVSRRVTLYDSMNVSTDPDCAIDNGTLHSQEPSSSSPPLYIRDVYDDSKVYNVVEVVVEVWV